MKTRADKCTKLPSFWFEVGSAFASGRTQPALKTWNLKLLGGRSAPLQSKGSMSTKNTVGIEILQQCI